MDYRKYASTLKTMSGWIPVALCLLILASVLLEKRHAKSNIKDSNKENRTNSMITLYDNNHLQGLDGTVKYLNSRQNELEDKIDELESNNSLQNDSRNKLPDNVGIVDPYDINEKESIVTERYSMQLHTAIDEGVVDNEAALSIGNKLIEGHDKYQYNNVAIGRINCSKSICEIQCMTPNEDTRNKYVYDIPLLMQGINGNIFVDADYDNLNVTIYSSNHDVPLPGYMAY